MKRPGVNRHEALADGVFAIVMTLLVLELGGPVFGSQSGDASLAEILLSMWPHYIAYVVSFLVLALFWAHHHLLFHYIRYWDGPVMLMNVSYLMFVSLVPFSAALVSHHWSEALATVIYGLNMVLPMGISTILLRYAAARPDMLRDGLSARFIRAEKTAGLVLLALMVGATSLSFILPILTVIAFGVLTAFFVGRALASRDGLSGATIDWAD